MVVIDISYEVFLILRPFLPKDTQLTSTYRSPAQQLELIKLYAAKLRLNTRGLNVNRPETWLPVLRKLRGAGISINAPAPGHGIPVTPHGRFNVVFDLVGSSLDSIIAGCKLAESSGVLKFRQIRKEDVKDSGGKVIQRAVHLETEWVSEQAFERLYAETGFLHA